MSDPSQAVTVLLHMKSTLNIKKNCILQTICGKFCLVWPSTLFNGNKRLPLGRCHSSLFKVVLQAYRFIENLLNLSKKLCYHDQQYGQNMFQGEAHSTYMKQVLNMKCNCCERVLFSRLFNSIVFPWQQVLHELQVLHPSLTLDVWIGQLVVYRPFLHT